MFNLFELSFKALAEFSIVLRQSLRVNSYSVLILFALRKILAIQACSVSVFEDTVSLGLLH